MVNEVLSNQTLELRSVQITRPAVQRAPAPAGVATGGNTLPQNTPKPVDLSRVVEGLNQFMRSTQRDLTFRVDETTGRTIITVVNPETDEIVRQIPPEEVLTLARTLREAGMLFDALA